MTLTAHPDKDVLMMFGGEYFDGSRVCLSFIYEQTWSFVCINFIVGLFWLLITDKVNPSLVQPSLLMIYVKQVVVFCVTD